MDAENDYLISQARDAYDMIETIQSMIDVSAARLEGLRTQCSTSAELTQQEIRTLEGKLVKHFSRQLWFKSRFRDELGRELPDVPRLAQWLRVVGLSQEAVEAICSRVPSMEALRERSDYELKALLSGAREEEQRRLCRAMQRLRAYTEALAHGETAGAEMPLYWDSWERARGSPRPHARTRPRADHTHQKRGSNAGGGKSPTTPVSKKKQSAQLPTPAALTKSRSHEAQLCRPEDLSDNNSQSSVMAAIDGTPPASPQDSEADHTPLHKSANSNHVYLHNSNSSTPVLPGGGGAPRSPRTPVGRCMAHDIAHRFTKTFNMIAVCDYCEKQMLFGSAVKCKECKFKCHRFAKTFNMVGVCDYCEKIILLWSGLKCKECKFKCHRECESKVPPSCGLPPEFVHAFKEKIHKDGGGGGFYGTVSSPVSSRAGFLSSLRAPRKHHSSHHHHQHGPDSSSNTSSCNSSTPSSPALQQPPTPHHHGHAKPQFHFPEVKHSAASSPNHAAQSPRSIPELKEDFTASIKSNESGHGVSLSGSGSTDSGPLRGDSLDYSGKDQRWPRQNSLSMKEWDIPYDELKLVEVIGRGRFGTVYRGSWHGAVAVKLLHVHSLHDDAAHDAARTRDQTSTSRSRTSSWATDAPLSPASPPTAAIDPVALDTFKHEVATFRKTRHENLVLFMGACMKPPKLAIVTSLCKGNTLHTHIHLRKDKFTANKSVVVAQQISQGMGYLHARGIIHKDLKSKNIFLENGKVVITDFGLFSVTKLCFGNNLRGDSLGIPPGWLCYLAPELIRALRPHASLHLPFSKETDVYAFGTVWYELLNGEFPFKGQPPEAIIWQVGKGVKQSLANMQANRDIKDILMQCWSYRSSERPDFPHLLSTLQKLPRKRLARSPSHPVHLSRSADSVF